MTILLLIKTFFYLRIFRSLTQLVIMIERVIRDLLHFILLFALILIHFSIILSILGFGNFINSQDEEVIESMEQLKEKGLSDETPIVWFHLENHNLEGQEIENIMILDDFENDEGRDCFLVEITLQERE